MVLGDCSSDPALSGVRGLNSELKTNNHSLPLSPYSLTTYRKKRFGMLFSFFFPFWSLTATVHLCSPKYLKALNMIYIRGQPIVDITDTYS